MTTYAEILKAEESLPPTVGGHPLAGRINEILAAAEDNADDDKGRIESIIGLLCYEPSADILAWFAAIGISPHGTPCGECGSVETECECTAMTAVYDHCRRVRDDDTYLDFIYGGKWP